jgi:hypothetical protein
MTSAINALSTAWPAIALILPILVLVSAIVFLAKGDRRSFSFLLALLACYVMGALLMEFFVFMAARMARGGNGAPVPVLGTGTKQLLETLSSPRSIAAPAFSLAAVAAYAVLVSYLWVAVAWVLHLRGGSGKRGGSKKKPAKTARKPAKG